jgi:hypothetical protein
MFRVMGVTVAVLATAVGVAAAGDGAKAREGASSAFTLGVVQKELRLGQSQAEVVERLGSPNILTRDGDGREAWVYDRIASDVEVSSAGVSLGGLGSGVGGTFAGLLGISGSKSKDKLRSSQRTLTVVVRFSVASTVESFTWHNSRF